MQIRSIVMKFRSLAIAIAILSSAVASVATAQVSADRCVVPAGIRDPILHEISGELALQHVQMLAANRIRPVEEYTDTFFETTYVSELAERYGLSDVRVDYYPAGDIWVPEEAELWMVEPQLKKMSSLTMVPAALASGSASGDVEAEVVYVVASPFRPQGRPHVHGCDGFGSIAVPIPRTRVVRDAVVEHLDGVRIQVDDQLVLDPLID